MWPRRQLRYFLCTVALAKSIVVVVVVVVVVAAATVVVVVVAAAAAAVIGVTVAVAIVLVQGRSPALHRSAVVGVGRARSRHAPGKPWVLRQKWDSA